MQNSNKIIIITTNPFPVGLAGTNRISSYCKGFLSHGFQPEIICIRPTEPSNKVINSSANGVYNGIKYSYPGRTTIRVASFWGRRKNDLFAKYATLRAFYKTLKEGNVSFIIIYGNCISVELVSILFSRYFKKCIYKEESENPEVYFPGNTIFSTSLKKWFSVNKIYSYYSGVLVMTHPLKDYFLKKGISTDKILIVPQTVDKERFENKNEILKLSLPDEYVAYVGSLNQTKDGVITLVESFTKVVAKYPDLNLVIAGDGTQQEKDTLLLLIKELNLTGKVQYIGCLASDYIPSFLKNAKLLVSCRPNSVQSEFGFPTKVAEYLSSGKPVVSTATGDLAFYLKDRVNAFVSAKAAPDTFSLKILEVLQDYGFAMNVAKNALELVSNNFSPVIQTKNIIEFCEA